MMTYPLYGLPPYRLVYGNPDEALAVYFRALAMGAVWQ